MDETEHNPNEELPLYEKLLENQKDELAEEYKKLTSMVRQLVATENKIDRLKKRMREEGNSEQLG